jgi:hypothetical protein
LRSVPKEKGSSRFMRLPFSSLKSFLCSLPRFYLANLYAMPAWFFGNNTDRKTEKEIVLMNPGYLSAFCLLLIAVLAWMGLLDGLLSRLQIRLRTFYALLFAHYLASGWYIPFGPYITLSVGTFLLPIVFFLFLWGRQERESRNYSFAAALLAGVTLFLLRYIIRLDPVLHVVDEVYLVAGVAVVLTVVMSRQADQALIIMGLGLCLMEIVTQVLVYSSVNAVTLGEFAFRDALVFSLLTGLLVHAAVFRCIDASGALARKVLVRRSR